MKKLIICLLIAAALTGISCKSYTPPVIEGEVTQEKVNDALEMIYDNYRGKLDLTGAQSYTVARGDSLVQIAHRFFGSLTDVGSAGPQNGFYFPVIMLASDSHIVDPDLIEPGMQLTIIDLERNLNNRSSRQAIKDCLKDIAHIYNRKGNTGAEQGLLTLADSL